MTQPSPAATELAAEVARVLADTIAALQRASDGARVFSIAEAAERLNMAPRTLEQMCRAGIVTHTKIGRSRGLTAKQIEIEIARNEQRGVDATPAEDEMEQARRLTLNSGARRGAGRAA